MLATAQSKTKPGAARKGCASPEPRSGERYLAWGVSPRIETSKKMTSRGAAADVRRVAPVAHGDSRESVAPPGLIFFQIRTLGLTPQAMYLSLLRSSEPRRVYSAPGRHICRPYR